MCNQEVRIIQSQYKTSKMNVDLANIFVLKFDEIKSDILKIFGA